MMADEQRPNEMPRLKDELIQVLLEIKSREPDNAELVIQDANRIAEIVLRRSSEKAS